jgi:hypothetical protein
MTEALIGVVGQGGKSKPRDSDGGMDYGDRIVSYANHAARYAKWVIVTLQWQQE